MGEQDRPLLHGRVREEAGKPVLLVGLLRGIVEEARHALMAILRGHRGGEWHLSAQARQDVPAPCRSSASWCVTSKPRVIAVRTAATSLEYPRRIAPTMRPSATTSLR